MPKRPNEWPWPAPRAPKPKKPLKARKPMNRGNGLKRGKWLSFKSGKRIAEKPERDNCNKVCRRRAHGRCEIAIPGVCLGAGTHCHEKLPSGRGGSRRDSENCVWTCWPCNQAVHSTHQAWATERGFLISGRQHVTPTPGVLPV